MSESVIIGVRNTKRRSDDMVPIKHNQLDCETLANALSKLGITVTEIADLTGLVPHVGYGGAAKSFYISPKSGKPIYVLERNGLCSPDSWLNDVWQFADDFTIDEAKAFLQSIK